jgi:transposase InsO family protein
LGVSRASLYYVSKLEAKDWAVKVRMEEELQINPSYGSRRMSDALGMCRERAKRIMKKYGIKPYRRRGKKRPKTKPKRKFPNLLLTTMPRYQNHIWATDFTELKHHGKKVYVSTIIDLFTRNTVGVHVAVRKGAPLTVQTLSNALFHQPPPEIFHSDNGKEYEAKSFMEVLEDWNIKISRSRPGAPWENGYQESFYDKFKVDFGDPGRFKTLGELVAEIYRTVWAYNHTRIHSALRMPPAAYAEKVKQQKNGGFSRLITIELLSKEISP